MLERTETLAAISDAGIIKMTPREWSGIPDNPRQRDTEAHAKKATHLREPHPTHAMVNMASMDDGRRFKLDGHTRSFLWDSGEVAAPQILSVQNWRCASIDDVKRLYNTFDSAGAVETGKDKLRGGLRELNLVFQSDILQSGRYLNAMAMAYELMFGNKVSRNRDTYDLLAYWAPELKLFDQCNGTGKRFHGATVAAALLTLRRYGTGAIEFWRAYAANRGMKIGDEMDGVQALDERITASIKTGKINGRGHALKMIGIALAAHEHYRRGELYKAETTGGGPRALKETALKNWLIAARNTIRSW